jgi:epoxyqueuosine reductase
MRLAVLNAAYAAELCEVGLAAGLDRVGVASAEPFADTRRALEERAAAGLAATMQFTYRNPARSTDPAATLPDARALVVGARSYAHEVPAPPSDHVVPSRVARYAADDHYAALREALDAIAGRLRADGHAARVLLDDNALVDRAAAHRAGLGWYGKNAHVLVPGIGSWVVLGSVLTDAALPPTSDEPVADGCGVCHRCLDVCPTGALVEPGVVDARRCLAWLVQAQGPFPPEHRVALGSRLYGCDDCQEVCPPSRVTPVSISPAPSERDPVDGTSGRGDVAAAAGPGDWVDVVDLLAGDDTELLARFGRWYIPQREPRYLRRNALVVLGNSGRRGQPSVRAALASALADPDALVRGHAVWAARRLGELDLLDALAGETDATVLDELARPLEPA